MSGEQQSHRVYTGARTPRHLLPLAWGTWFLFLWDSLGSDPYRPRHRIDIDVCTTSIERLGTPSGTSGTTSRTSSRRDFARHQHKKRSATCQKSEVSGCSNRTLRSTHPH